MTSRRRFLAAAIAGTTYQADAQVNAVRFGVLADVQYADRDTAGKRAYRDSLNKLRLAAQALAPEKPAFTIHLGDLVDGGQDNFDRIQPIFNELPGKHYQVLGNHDYFASREQVLAKFGLKQAYYSFVVKPWRFIVLDGMQVSVKGGWSEESANHREALRLLGELRQAKAPNAHDWNGAAGKEQRAWLARELTSAERGNERAIVFCHFPTLTAACRPEHLLWDHAEVLRTLEASRATAAYMSGHDHSGGYAEQSGIHHVTLPGVVENDVANAVRICEAWPHRLVLRRPGESGGQDLRLRV